jgi:hypothetical protein
VKAFVTGNLRRPDLADNRADEKLTAEQEQERLAKLRNSNGLEIAGTLTLQAICINGKVELSSGPWTCSTWTRRSPNIR